jgi:hypothetical protein
MSEKAGGWERAFLFDRCRRKLADLATIDR